MGRKVALGILAAILLVVAAIVADKVGGRGGSAGSGAPLGFNELPDAEIVGVSDGRKVKLSSFKGKALLVNFWASWCEACMEEMPTIVKLHKMLKGEGFEVISINVDEEPKKVVPGIVQKFGMEFPVYVDQEEKLAAAFHVVAIPYNIVVGKDGKIAWTESGDRDWAAADIAGKIRGLMK